MIEWLKSLDGLERYCLAMCVVMTLYLAAQCIRADL